MSQIGLFEPPPYEYPPVTRWWLEGEPGRPLTLMSETAPNGSPACPVAPPERSAHAEWLSQVAIGVTTGWLDGAHGWVDRTTLTRRT